MADIFDELVGAGAAPEELVAQLRRQRKLGNVGALSYDKQISGLGNNLSQEALQTAGDLRNRQDKAQAREDQQAFARWQQEQAMAGRAEDRAFRREGLKQARDLAERQMANAREIAGLKQSAAGARQVSPFDRARQMQIGRESAEWDATGKVQTQAAINDLTDALTALQQDKSIGGSKVAWMPFDQKIRAFVDPKGLDVQRKANRVTAASLRDMLGAAFTQKEGEEFRQLDYDPSLSNEQNQQNIERKLAILESHIRRKNALFNQYRGTDRLPDLEGQTMNTLSDDDIVNSILSEQQ